METTVFVYDASSKLVAEYSTQLASVQQVRYLTQDHLGSTRVVTNENGAVTDRKDYSAFGEETSTSQRTSALGYRQPQDIPTIADQPRNGYTGYERDDESGLQFAQARYFSAVHGRFTSVDPLASSATIRNPQSFNRYSYVLNSPYKFSDPLGLLPLTSAGACGQWCRNSDGGGGGPIDLYSDNGSTISIALVSFDHVFDIVKANVNPDVTYSQAKKIAVAMYNVLTRGNASAIQVVSAVLGSRAHYGVTNEGAAKMTLSTDISSINAAIQSGKLSVKEALGFTTLHVSLKEIDNPIGLEGSIIHEARHALINAEVLSSLATGDPKKYQNETSSINEYRAKLEAAMYFESRGKAYADFGWKIGLLDVTGKVDKPVSMGSVK